MLDNIDHKLTADAKFMQNLEIQKCTEYTCMHKRIKRTKQSIRYGF